MDKFGFTLRTDKAFNSIFSFVKEDGLTFLCLKEKLQKKQASPSLDPLVRMGSAHSKASSTLRERLRYRRVKLATNRNSNTTHRNSADRRRSTVRLAQGCCAARCSLRNFDRILLRCADKTLVTPTAYFSPSGCCEIVLFLLFYGIFAVILAKAHWGLNHDAGMSADLWRHPPAPIQAKAPTNRGTRYRTR